MFAHPLSCHVIVVNLGWSSLQIYWTRVTVVLYNNEFFLLLMWHFVELFCDSRSGLSRTPGGRGTWVSLNSSRQCRFWRLGRGCRAIFSLGSPCIRIAVRWAPFMRPFVLPALLARFVWCPVFYFSSGVGSGFGYISLVYLISLCGFIMEPCDSRRCINVPCIVKIFCFHMLVFAAT
jgi:hypothetical protein